MGAGTLDLTYFEVKKQGNQKIIEVKGRMGACLAGNYIDAVIAEAIEQLHSEKLIFDLFGPHGNLAGRLYFRNIIRDEVKPYLNKPDQEFVLTEEAIVSEDVKFTSKQILESEPMKRFLEKATKEMLENFATLFSDSQNASLRDFSIDRVIMSGRSVQLNALKEALEKSLQTLSKKATVELAGGNNSLKKCCCAGSATIRHQVQIQRFSCRDQKPEYNGPLWNLVSNRR